MKRGVRIVAVVCVGLAAVLATTAEASSSGDSTPTSQQTQGEATQSPSDGDSQAGDSQAGDSQGADGAASELGIGDEARDGKFAFTVSGVKCGVKKVGSEYLNSKAQGQFCLVTMSVKNIGDEAQTFDAGSQKGVTSTGAEVDADTSASLYANEDSNSFLEKINPGNSIDSVVVVYDIAKDQDLTAVRLHDSMFSDGVLVSLK